MIITNPFIGIFHRLFGGDTQLEYLANDITIIMLAAVILCFTVSELARNYSQVDKLWSLMPGVYGVLAYLAFPSPRLLLMSCLVIIWGLRLSYNFYRKGGYNIIPWKGEEDYRWKIVRELPILKGRLRFGIFNLFFISFYQHFLIFLFSSPLLIAAGHQDKGLTMLDAAAAILMAVFILLETIADNQQFRFRKEKGAMVNSDTFRDAEFGKGFVTSGLWKYVRHPNFASEQAIWICFYFFGVAASGEWINWTLSGPVLLVLLFVGSTVLTENISSKKYPGYEEYKRNVPAFIPRLFGSGKNR